MFRWLKNKNRLKQINTGIASAFSCIKQDLYSQKKALEELHEKHAGLSQSTTINHQRIADWIKHFNKSVNRLEKDLDCLEENLENRFDNLTATSLKLFQEAYARNIKDVKQVKDEIIREVEVFLSEKQGKARYNEGNEGNEDNVNNVMPTLGFEDLSMPEQWLVRVLFNTESPLSYSQIADKTGKSINTVRVYMNQLKPKGWVDESSLPNGSKLFSLKHKAKVKKLYNL